MKYLYCILGREGIKRTNFLTHIHALYGYCCAEKEWLPCYRKKEDYAIVWQPLPCSDLCGIKTLNKGCILVIKPEEVNALKKYQQVKIVLLDIDRTVAAQRLLEAGESAESVNNKLCNDDEHYPWIMDKADFVIDATRMTISEVAEKFHSYVRHCEEG